MPRSRLDVRVYDHMKFRVPTTPFPKHSSQMEAFSRTYARGYLGHLVFRNFSSQPILGKTTLQQITAFLLINSFIGILFRVLGFYSLVRFPPQGGAP